MIDARCEKSRLVSLLQLKKHKELIYVRSIRNKITRYTVKVLYIVFHPCIGHFPHPYELRLTTLFLPS